jgi:hypothetical protein
MRLEPVLRRRLAVAAIAAVALSGCAKRPLPGVDVKSISTDLAFGLPPSPAPVPPPNTAIETEQPLGIVDFGPTVYATPKPVVVATPQPACREAGPNDFPDQPASTTAIAQPKVGTYKWRVNGKQNVQALGTVPLPQTVKKSIKEVKTSGDFYTFTQSERELTFGSTTVVDSTFEVRNTASPGRDAGIYLQKIVRTAGGTSRTFTPQPPVLYLPFPTRPGLSIDSVGVDPVTLEALHNTGSVTKRFRVDACGKVLDSWFVDGSQQFVSSTGTSYQRNYDYSMAPQYGGLLVFEHVETPCANQDSAGACTPPGDMKFDAHIGQLDPDPLEPTR